MAKVLISLPDALLAEADRAAEAQHRTRSDLFREALRLLLERERSVTRSWADISGDIRTRVDPHWLGTWNSTDVVREDRDADDDTSPRR